MPLPRITYRLTFRLVSLAVLLLLIGALIRFAVASSVLKSGIQEVVPAQQLSLAQYVAADIESKVLLRRALLEKLAAELPPTLWNQPDALNVDSLLAGADSAMYAAKQAGGNTYRFAE